MALLFSLPQNRKALMVLYIVALSKRKSTNSLFMLVDVEKHEVGIYRKGFRGSRMSELGSLTRLNNFKTSTLNILYFILQSSNFNSFAFLFYFVILFCSRFLSAHHGKRWLLILCGNRPTFPWVSTNGCLPRWLVWRALAFCQRCMWSTRSKAIVWFLGKVPSIGDLLER